MEYLHRMDYVVHNDIKPENIFFLGEKVFIGGKGISINSTIYLLLKLKWNKTKKKNTWKQALI